MLYRTVTDGTGPGLCYALIPQRSKRYLGPHINPTYLHLGEELRTEPYGFGILPLEYAFVVEKLLLLNFITRGKAL